MSATLKYQPQLGCATESDDQGAPRSSSKHRPRRRAHQRNRQGPSAWQL